MRKIEDPRAAFEATEEEAGIIKKKQEQIINKTHGEALKINAAIDESEALVKAAEDQAKKDAAELARVREKIQTSRDDSPDRERRAQFEAYETAQKALKRVAEIGMEDNYDTTIQARQEMIKSRNQLEERVHGEAIEDNKSLDTARKNTNISETRATYHEIAARDRKDFAQKDTGNRTAADIRKESRYSSRTTPLRKEGGDEKAA